MRPLLTLLSATLLLALPSLLVLGGDEPRRPAIAKGDTPSLPLTNRLFAAPKDYFDKGPRGKALKYYVKSDPLKLLDYKIGEQSAHVYLPPEYDEANAKDWGLLVFISPHPNGGDLMGSFKESLGKNKLLFAAPNNVANEKPVPLRMAVALDTLATMRMCVKFNPQRVYLCGIGGGGPPATLAAILYPEQVKGCLSIANGLAVANVPADNKMMIPSMIPYFAKQDFDDLRKRKLRFAFVTGDKDENHKPILLTGPSWKTSGLDFRIFDVPGLSNHLPPHNVFGPVFDELVNWLDDKEVKGYEPRYDMYGIGSTTGPGKKKL